MSSEIVLFLHDPDLDVSYDDVIPMVETVDVFLEKSVEDLHQEAESDSDEDDVTSEVSGDLLRKNEGITELKAEVPTDKPILTENKEIPKETSCEPQAAVQTNSQDNLSLKTIAKDEPAVADGNKELKQNIPKDEPVVASEIKELKQEVSKDESFVPEENKELKKGILKFHSILTDENKEITQEIPKYEAVVKDENKEMTREIIDKLQDKEESDESLGEKPKIIDKLQDKEESDDSLEISTTCTTVIEVQERKKSISKFTRVRKFVSSLTRRKKGKNSDVKAAVPKVTPEIKAADDFTAVIPDQERSNEEAVAKLQKSLSRRILDGMCGCLRAQTGSTDKCAEF